MVNLLTPYEMAWRGRRKIICNQFREIAAEQPTASNHRIMVAISQEHKLTVPGVRKILIEEGVIPARMK